MKITIEIKPDGSTTVNIDNEVAAVVTSGEPVAPAPIVDNIPIKPDPPHAVRPAVRKPATERPVARVTKTCAGCGNTFVAEGRSIARAKFCADCKTTNHKTPAPAGTKPNTKACTKCGDDMPATSMYTECARCRPPRVNTKIKPCKLCTKLGRPCKRHRDGPVHTIRPADTNAAIADAMATTVNRAAEVIRETARQVKPTFLPGYEKTPEEIEAARPRVSVPTELAATHTPGMKRLSSPDFDDPWNCQKCRDHMHTCDFHAGMEADGRKPPTRSGLPPASPLTF